MKRENNAGDTSRGPETRNAGKSKRGRDEAANDSGRVRVSSSQPTNGRGETAPDSDDCAAPRRKRVVVPDFKDEVGDICNDLIAIQKKHATLRKISVSQKLQLCSAVAVQIGYSSHMTKKERDKHMDRAKRIIKEVNNGTCTDEKGLEHEAFILAATLGIKAMQAEVRKYKRMLTKAATKLPVAKWVLKKEQDGFGLISLGELIGETGDLRKYASPSNVYSRMGCAPITKDGVTRMPSTFRRLKKMTRDDWIGAGYVPHRRAASYVFGDNLMKLNRNAKTKKPYPFRARYLEAKRLAVENHPEWEICVSCGGSGKKNDQKCEACKGTGKSKLRYHIHANLLCIKRFYRELWRQWQRVTPRPGT